MKSAVEFLMRSIVEMTVKSVTKPLELKRADVVTTDLMRASCQINTFVGL